MKVLTFFSGKRLLSSPSGKRPKVELMEKNMGNLFGSLKNMA
jgi:hypothetical protein